MAPIKPPPKRLHHSRCDDLYNRLQQPGGAYDAGKELAKIVNISYNDPMHMLHLAMHIMERFDCRLETLQMNYPDCVSFRCCLSYTDRTKKPIHGHLYPVKTVVKTSPSMVLSVTLAYIELCKHVGRFI